ncbi:MAG: flagellar basal body P-ring formation protein FlgA [Phycisphaerae bacterium]
MQDARTDILKPPGRGRARPAWFSRPCGRWARSLQRVGLREAAWTAAGTWLALADVADISGDGSSLAGGFVIAAAPQPGSSGVVDIAHLQSVLTRRGVNLSTWVFRGASRCVISRPADVVPVRPRAEPLTADRRSPGPAGPPAASTPSTRPAGTPLANVIHSPGVASGTFESAIHEHLRKRLTGVGGGALSVRFSPATARLLNLSTDQYRFEIVDRGERALGVIPLEVTVQDRGQDRPAQVVQVVCEAALRRPAVTARRNINRGEVVQAADLALEERSFDRLEDVGLSDPAPLIGQRARRMLRQGELVGVRDLEPVPLVARNDLVAVVVRKNGLLIHATARAMSAGCYGETIPLRSELSKETFQGVVTGPKTVEPAGNGPPPAATLAGGAR